MTNYISEEVDSGISFEIDKNQFSDIEIGIVLENIMKFNEDTTWAIGIGGSIYAAPLAYNNVIYFGACDKNFYAIDAETGKEKWRFSVTDVILSTVAIDSDILYFGSYDGCLYAVSTKGELIWRFDAGDKISSDPFVWENMVYFGSHNKNIYAVEKRTGNLIWRFATKGAISSSAIVEDDIVFMGSNDKNLYAIDAKMEKEIWRFRTNGEVRYKPVIWENKIIFGSLDGCLYAVNKDGKLIWKFATNNGIGTYPLIFDNILYVGSRDMNYYALNNEGKILWKYKCKSFPNEIFIYNNIVYLGCCENDLYALDVKTGKKLWVFPTQGWVLRIREYNGKIIFGSWGCNLFAITPNGKLLWKFPTSLSYQSPLQPEEDSKTKTFKVVWKPKITKDEKEKYTTEEGSRDYGLNMSKYGSMNTNYTSKKKKGYLN